MPKLRLQKPSRTCADELDRFELRAVIPQMNDLLEDVGFKVDQLKYEELPVALPDDELFALVAYTYDTGEGKEGNLYFELNNALRKRGSADRATLMDVWGAYLYYLLSGLSKLASTKTIVYRGYPDKAKVQAQYQLGRPIQWGAFSSTSTDIDATKAFTNMEHGVVFKLTVLSGKIIKAYSYFADESEVLVSPQARFVVSSEPYVADDGYTYVDMVEQNGTLFIS